VEEKKKRPKVVLSMKYSFLFWFMSALTFCGDPDLHDVIVYRLGGWAM